MRCVNVFDIYSGGEKVLCRTNPTAVRRGFSRILAYIERGNIPHGCPMTPAPFTRSAEVSRMQPAQSHVKLDNTSGLQVH